MLIVVAGPNGAGKSSMSDQVVKHYGLRAFDFDHEFFELHRQFDYDPHVAQGIREQVGNQFLSLFEEAKAKKAHFAYETNLHLNSDIEGIRKAISAGLSFELNFFYMPNAALCKLRVKHRVIYQKKHNVEPEEIERRFQLGLKNLELLKTDAIILRVFDASGEWSTRVVYERMHDEVLIYNEEFFSSQHAKENLAFLMHR